MSYDYRIVYGGDARELEDAVNERIAEGWRPAGGITAYTDGAGETVVCQAMTRRRYTLARLNLRFRLARRQIG